MQLCKLCLIAILATPWAWAEPSVRAELGIPNLGVAKRQVRDYYRNGGYRRDLQSVAQEAQSYLEQNLPRYALLKPALVLDIDETSISNLEHFQRYDMAFLPQEFVQWIDSAQSPAIPEVLDLYRWSRARGVVVFFLSGRREGQRAATDRNLRQAGYLDWQEIILKPDGSNELSSHFKPLQRKRIIEQGYSIVLNMGDQDSDLSGGYADSEFKLPNPMYWIP